jgi:hypothetical protein
MRTDSVTFGAEHEGGDAAVITETRARDRNRSEVRELAERLTMEYSGAIPPGQVLALVFRADRSLASLGNLPVDARIQICENVVRRLLTDRLAHLSVSPSAAPSALPVRTT